MGREVQLQVRKAFNSRSSLDNHDRAFHVRLASLFWCPPSPSNHRRCSNSANLLHRRHMIACIIVVLLGLFKSKCVEQKMVIEHDLAFCVEPLSPTFRRLDYRSPGQRPCYKLHEMYMGRNQNKQKACVALVVSNFIAELDHP